MEERHRGTRVSRKGQGHSRRQWVSSMAAGNVVIVDTDENPQQRELGPRRQWMKRRSTGAPTGPDRAAGQRDAGSTVGTAYSAAQSLKPDMMLKYISNGVLYWYDGGVRRVVVRNRAAMPEARRPRKREVTWSTTVACSKCRAYKDPIGYCRPRGRFTPACCVREITVVGSKQSIVYPVDNQGHDPLCK